VEACTVTALDAITAFAFPNPNCPSQSRRFFQVWLLFGLSRRANHSDYFGPQKLQARQSAPMVKRVCDRGLVTAFVVANTYELLEERAHA